MRVMGFLEKLDGLDYDSLFIFEDLAYGFIPNEAGAAFGIAQMDRIEELWELRNSRFDSYYKFFENYQNQFIVPQTLDGTETTWICFLYKHQIHLKKYIDGLFDDYPGNTRQC